MTLRETIQARAGHGWIDLLVTVFDAGVAYGSGQPWQAETTSAADLISTIKAAWHTENACGERWAESAASQPPDWLRAYAERVAALGDAQSPEL